MFAMIDMFVELVQHLILNPMENLYVCYRHFMLNTGTHTYSKIKKTAYENASFPPI